MIKTDYTREELIAICERSVVPLDKWSDRDTPHSHEKLGLCWVMLKAGCPFHVHPAKNPREACYTDERTIWLSIAWPGFNDIEMSTGFNSCDEQFYLPTPSRLDECKNRDWY